MNYLDATKRYQRKTVEVFKIQIKEPIVERQAERDRERDRDRQTERQRERQTLKMNHLNATKRYQRKAVEVFKVQIKEPIVTLSALVLPSQSVSIQVEDQPVARAHPGDVEGLEVRTEAVAGPEDLLEGGNVGGGFHEVRRLFGIECLANALICRNKISPI
jgi:hypothetical protein